MAETFSLALSTELNEHKSALPANFNIERFVQNSVALLNGNDALAKFAQQYGTTQIKAGLMRAAYQGLDALNGEIYLIPYSGTLQFMPSFKGMQKMAKRYSKRPIKDIYSRIVREGDEFEVGVKDGSPTINFKEKPFNDGKIQGAFAVALFDDGGLTYEVMSKDEIESCRKVSKAKNSPAWSQFWTEMARKTVVRRLCKNITLDMDAESKEVFEAGTEIETDPVQLSENEISENANRGELEIIDGEAFE